MTTSEFEYCGGCYAPQRPGENEGRTVAMALRGANGRICSVCKLPCFEIISGEEIEANLARRRQAPSPLTLFVDTKTATIADKRIDLIVQLLPDRCEIIRHDGFSAEGGTPKARAAAIELARLVTRQGPGAFSLVVAIQVETLAGELEAEMGGF